jgi:hypothetical protein
VADEHASSISDAMSVASLGVLRGDVGLDARTFSLAVSTRSIGLAGVIMARGLVRHLVA